MEMEKNKNVERESQKSTGESQKKCSDRSCPFHGNLSARGRTFEGKVIKKFAKRIVLQFERTIYIRKYERYAKARTKIHAHLPDCMEKTIEVGDYIQIKECRPLSKLIHFVAIGKLRDRDQKINIKEKRK